MKPDLTYAEDDLFIRFYPENKNGVMAWNEMAVKNNVASATFYKIHKKAIIAQLKAHGYCVRKARQIKETADQLLEELTK